MFRPFFLILRLYGRKTYKPKLRITTLEDNGSYIQDRLVDAYTEMNSGPKVQHKGPIRIEVTLTNKQDVENFKNYLDKLVGNLPIKEQSVGRGRPSTGSKQLTESPREDILADVEKMVEEGKSQQEIIKYLRELGFVFILTEDFLFHFPGFEFNSKDVGEATDNKQYPNSYSWMARCIKRAKDPKADKFDPMVIFGFSILSGPSKKIVPYLYKERKKPLRASVGKKTISFSQAEFTKFPKYQLEEERLKFSAEMRQLMTNPEKKPSKFFLRWAPDVLLSPNAYESLKRLNIKFANDNQNDNIPFLEGYFISKRGRLWSRYDKSGHITKDKWHRVKYNTSKQGYKFIQRKGKIFYIHRLVAMVYIPNPENKAYVCHKDNVPRHNNVSNLYWGTPSENTQQCIRDGRGYIGDKNPRAKVKNLDREIIRRKYTLGLTINELTREYNLSRSAIRKILYLSI